MNTFLDVAPFAVSEFSPASTLLFSSTDTISIEKALLERVTALPPGALLLLSFRDCRISSEAARQLLQRLLLSRSEGRLNDRYVVLADLGASKYNVDAMLKIEGLVAAHRGANGTELLGKVDGAAKEAFEWASKRGLVTARDLADSLELPSISAATNRLTTLAKLGLARRVADRPLPGGGREQLFVTVH